ncbi:MAG: hypothetical protein GXY83_15635 [Rhodopirellula sp.]|nr:hypothetical protein [Rhodopirellula sp.]
MPIYCYVCDSCGHPTEVFRHVPGAPQHQQCDYCGKRARRDYARESRCGNADTGELVSVAAGVMPEQAAEANREAARRGISDLVRFDHRTGDAIFRNRDAKLRALRCMRLYDKDEVRG